MKIIKNILYLLLDGVIGLAHFFYKMEGVNMFLLFLPAEMLVKTLRRYGAAIGENVDIRAPLIIHNAEEGYENLIVGNDCHFGKDIFLDLKDQIQIGDRVILSMRTTLITHMHVGRSKLNERFPPTHAPIQIESDVYLGVNATILQGVRIGESVLIGACSLVLKDVPSKTIVAGSPAKEIKKSV